MITDMTSAIVKQIGMDAGATVVGIASARDFGLAPDGCKPSDVLEGCLSVIVLGVPFPEEALGMGTVEYTEMRNAILKKMSGIAKSVSKKLQRAGQKAKDISASGGRFVEGKHYGHISLKHAAELSGLGRITRNYLLTSAEYGNLLWLSAVLTDADLVPDEKAGYTVCDHCNKCVEICPMGALDNPDVFGNKRCDRNFVIANGKLEIKCFLCRRVCPYCFGTCAGKA